MLSVVACYTIQVFTVGMGDMTFLQPDIIVNVARKSYRVSARSGLGCVFASSALGEKWSPESFGSC